MVRGGGKAPSQSYFCDSPKKINGKSCQFFLLFLNIEMEGWGLLFEVRYHLGWSGGGPNGQNCPNFIRGDPVGSSRKEKILTKIGDKLDMLQATFWLFFCWDILVSARYEIGSKTFGQKVPNVLQIAHHLVSRPPPQIGLRSKYVCLKILTS